MPFLHPQAESTDTAAEASAGSCRNAGDWKLLVLMAVFILVLQEAFGGRFGFHRDELATLDDARHLAWGYVAYPPLTPFFGRISLTLFGTSLLGFRFFAALAQAGAVVLTGLIARELGGMRPAQFMAAVAAVPFCIVSGALMQYVAFDYLCWVLGAYFVTRLLVSDDSRWWIAIGASIGFGMLTKYTMGFFALGIAGGVLLTGVRHHLKSRWLWFGVAISILIFLPNVVWQAQNHFISLDFLRHIHARDVRIGRTKDFLPDQLKITLGAVPVWVAGLYFCLISKSGSRFRMLGWMYVIPLLLFVLAKGRGYYLGAAYPMLYAAGSVWAEQRLRGMNRAVAGAAQIAVWSLLAANVVLVTTIAIPPTYVNSPLWKFASRINGDLREEVGWPELVREVARIRDSVPQSEQARLGVLAANYGEAGAINLYGPRYGLPSAISGVNSFWQRGYGNPPPETLIVLGISERFLRENFLSCQLAGHTPNPYHVENEETADHPDIYLCRGLRQSWPEVWRNFRYYG